MLSPFCLPKSLAKSLNSSLADSIHGEKEDGKKEKIGIVLRSLPRDRFTKFLLPLWDHPLG